MTITSPIVNRNHIEGIDQPQPYQPACWCLLGQGEGDEVQSWRCKARASEVDLSWPRPKERNNAAKPGP